MNEQYHIELATVDHVPLLAAIEVAAAGIFPSGSIPDHIRSDSVPPDILLEAVQARLLWVALDEGRRPVGYALVQLVPLAPLAPLAPLMDNAALLAQMDVHPDHMRNGIGSALIQQVVENLRLRQKTALYLTTFTHVPWNAPFYAKQGFAPLTNEEEPLFIKEILEEERRYGLKNRTAMRFLIKREHPA